MSTYVQVPFDQDDIADLLIEDLSGGVLGADDKNRLAL
jgi:hypothetical protein